MPYISPSPPTTYVFKCDICQGDIRVYHERNLTKCTACRKKLCTNCNHFGLCPAHFAQIPSEDREELTRLDERFQAEQQSLKKEMKKRVYLLLLCLGIPVGSTLLSLGGLFSIRDNYVFYAIFYFSTLIPAIWIGLRLYQRFQESLTREKTQGEEEMAIIRKYFPEHVDTVFGVPLPP